MITRRGCTSGLNILDEFAFSDERNDCGLQKWAEGLHKGLPVSDRPSFFNEKKSPVMLTGREQSLLVS
jgi:hypothetical protein